MARLEDLTPHAAVRGILPDATVTVVHVQWFGSEALELTYKAPDGRVANELLYRHREEMEQQDSLRSQDLHDVQAVERNGRAMKG